MLIQSKVQINQKDYDFIKKVYKDFHYRSLSEYMREAIAQKVKEHQKILREMKRKDAMMVIAKGRYENLFESIEGDDFETW